MHHTAMIFIEEDGSPVYFLIHGMTLIHLHEVYINGGDLDCGEQEDELEKLVYGARKEVETGYVTSGGYALSTTNLASFRKALLDESYSLIVCGNAG